VPRPRTPVVAQWQLVPMSQLSLGSRIGTRLAAKPLLQPYPGWMLGSGRSANSAARLRRMVWGCYRRPFTVPWLDGLHVTLYPDNETSGSIFITGLYEPNEFCLLSKVLEPGMTFVDVGANMGLYSLYAASRVSATGRVLAIEPSRREMATLKSNVELNQLMNVTIRQVAVSDQVAEVELLVAAARNSGHNTLGAFGYNTPLDHRETIQSQRLDQIVQTEGLQKIHVIKMDIEGAELRALRGAVDTLQRDHPLVLLELSDRLLQHQGASSADVLSLLAQLDYRVYGFDAASGLPGRLPTKAYYDSENIIAVAGDSLPW
jgi:FkbM family methyltransferase